MSYDIGKYEEYLLKCLKHFDNLDYIEKSCNCTFEALNKLTKNEPNTKGTRRMMNDIYNKISELAKNS